MRRIFISTAAMAICAASALSPAALAGPPTLTITGVAGYSDGATPSGACGFHVDVSYSGKARKGDVVAGLLISENNGGIALLAPEPLGRSPFSASQMTSDPGGLVLAGQLFFDVQVNNRKGDTVSELQTDAFTLDNSTFVDGCPPAGQLVPAP